MKRRFYLIITLVILTGCVSSTNHENKGGTTQSALLPTSTVTLAPTETFTITPTPTFAPVPRQPINTPVEKDKDKIALELLETNNDCELPCWWGIIPNKTRWTDAEVFLKLFSKISERHSPKWDVYEVYSPLPVEYSDVYAVRAVFAAQEGIVREIEVGYFDEKTYHLAPFLRKYGIPDEILISTYSSDYGMPKNKVPLSLNLYYSQKGINALFGTDATVNGAQIIGCIETSPILYLWSSNEYNRSVDYIIEWDKDHIPYLSSEQAIGLNPQKFYEKYANTVNAPCLTTSTNLWQSQ